VKEIDVMRRIIERHQYEEIHEMIVDVQTANACVIVYDALKEENQAKADLMLATASGLHRFVNFAFSQVSYA
jgi:hypothetical protein